MSYDAAITAACELAVKARLIAGSIYAAKKMPKHHPYRLELEVTALGELTKAVKPLDESALRSVITTVAQILGQQDAEARVREAHRMANMTTAEVFRGL